MVSLLGPRVGKEDVDARQRCGWESSVPRLRRHRAERRGMLERPRSSISLSRLPTPGAWTSTARKSHSGIAWAIAAVVSPMPKPISRIRGPRAPEDARRNRAVRTGTARQSAATRTHGRAAGPPRIDPDAARSCGSAGAWRLCAVGSWHALPGRIRQRAFDLPASGRGRVFDRQSVRILPFRASVDPSRRAVTTTSSLRMPFARDAPDGDFVAAARFAHVGGHQPLTVRREHAVRWEARCAGSVVRCRRVKVVVSPDVV